MKDQLEVTINGVVYVPKVPEAEQTKDRPYQMTDSDWQRVIDEGFDCIFKDSDSPYRCVRKLKGCRKLVDEHMVEWNHCEVRRDVGHRQPHFGGPYPGNIDDLVLIKTLGGWHSNSNKAGTYFWGIASPITEYIVLEKGGEQ